MYIVIALKQSLSNLFDAWVGNKDSILQKGLEKQQTCRGRELREQMKQRI